MSTASRKVEIPCPFDEHIMKIVQYECSCGMPQPISRLYFCRHCLDIRCSFCLTHEVDSHYCPNCLENMPSAEARLKKNRCANCYDCPSCGHTLSTRANALQVPSADEPGKTVSKKVYYLACSFCRLTTRYLSLPDQTVASGGWLEPTNPSALRFAALQDHYRTMAQKEKLEKETRRFMSRKLSYMQLSDKYGLSAAVARKRAGLPPLGPVMPLTSGAPSLSDDEAAKDLTAPAQALSIEHVEPDPWSFIYDTPVDLCQINRLEQRLMQIETQSAHSTAVFPRHKHLMVKRSQRCRQCEHNLIKPEYSPASIKFKIQLAAYYHIPEIKVFALPDQTKLVPGAKVHFKVKVTNPTQHPSHIEILELGSVLLKRKEERLILQQHTPASKSKSEQKEDKPIPTTSSILASRQPCLVTASAQHTITPNAILVVPKVEGSHGSKILLPPRDDAAEFDDSCSASDIRGLVDDQTVVAWRRANKVCLNLCAILPAKWQGDLVTGFAMQFLYTNTVPALEQKEIQKVEVVVPVFVRLASGCDTQA